MWTEEKSYIYNVVTQAQNVEEVGREGEREILLPFLLYLTLEVKSQIQHFPNSLMSTGKMTRPREAK